MDKISEFFKELKNRFSNPLFFSFIIGWLATNWKIVIGLTFYSINVLARDDYSSYFDLIIKTSNFYNSFLIPFIIALCYTFIVPFIRQWIAMFNASVEKWGTEKTLNISKNGKIPVSKYITLRKKLDDREKTIEEIVEKESENISQIEELKNEKNRLSALLKTDEEIKEENSLLNNLNYYSGFWRIFNGSDNNEVRVNISQGHIYLNSHNQRNEAIYQIENLSYNINSREVIIVFKRLSSGSGTFYEVLYFTDNRNVVLKWRSGTGEIKEMRKEDY